MRLNNKLIVQLQDEVHKAKNSLEFLVKEEQSRCNHENIAECPYKPETHFTYASAPIRICLDCGLSEEGWGCGFRTLVEKSGLKPRGISRDDLYTLRVGEMITQ